MFSSKNASEMIMQSKTIIFLLSVHILICKIESVKNNLINNLFQKLKSKEKNSEINMLEPIVDSLHNPIQNSFRNLFRNSNQLPIDLNSAISQDTSSSLSIRNLPIQSSFVFTESLPKKIPLSSIGKASKSSKTSSSSSHYISSNRSTSARNTRNSTVVDVVNSPMKFNRQIGDGRSKMQSDISDGKQFSDHSSILKSVNNDRIRDLFPSDRESSFEKKPKNQKSIEEAHAIVSNRKPIEPGSIDTTNIVSNELIETLPLDSSAIFNRSLSEKKPIIGIPNTPLSSINFYYLVNDRSDSMLRNGGLRNYLNSQSFNQECTRLKEHNEKINNQVSPWIDSINSMPNKEMNRIGVRDQEFDLKESVISKSKLESRVHRKSSESSKKNLKTKSKTKKSPVRQKKRQNNKTKKIINKNVPEKLAIVPLTPIPTLDSILSHQSANMLNYHNNLLNLPQSIPQFAYFSPANQMIDQKQFIQYPSAIHFQSSDTNQLEPDRILNGDGIQNENQSPDALMSDLKLKKKSINKKRKRKKHGLANSSSNDRYVAIKMTKNRKTKNSKHPNTLKKLTITKTANKISHPKVQKIELTTKPRVVYKNAIYMNQKKDTKGEMFDAFRQSTIEEDLNIIKEIINNFNTYVKKDPTINEYYSANQNGGQIGEDNYIMDHLFDQPHQMKEKYIYAYEKPPLLKSTVKPSAINEAPISGSISKSKKKKHKPMSNSSVRKYPFFGFPLSNVHSNDMFDQENTYEEKMFQKHYPYRFGVNPGIRELVKKLLEWEAKITEWKENF